MPNGVCSRCGGTEIYGKHGGIWGYQGGLFVRVAGWFKRIRLDSLICMQCGYAVLQVPSKDLERLRAVVVKEGWTRMTRQNNGE